MGCKQVSQQSPSDKPRQPVVPFVCMLKVIGCGLDAWLPTGSAGIRHRLGSPGERVRCDWDGVTGTQQCDRDGNVQ